MLFNLASPTGV